MKYSAIAMSASLLVIAASAHAGDAPPVPPNPTAGAPAAGGTAPPPPPPPPAGADTLDALKKRIEALEKEVKKASENAVTTDDVNGVNNTLQTFLYQYQRDRDTGQTTTALRQLQIGGVVYLRADAFSVPEKITRTCPSARGEAASQPWLAALLCGQGDSGCCGGAASGAGSAPGDRLAMSR